MRILEHGYLLPGTVTDMGRINKSWIVKWPEDGFKSNSIFSHLQYCGTLRTMNEIPPMQLHPSEGLKEITVVLTDDSKYIVASDDIEKITCLSPGVYPVQETTADKRVFDLLIREEPVSAELNEAIRFLNNNIQRFNTLLANPKRRASVKGFLTKKNPSDVAFMNELPGTGRLTKHTAMLCGRVLAVAFKIEGRTISRSEAVRSMSRECQLVRRVVKSIENRWGTVDPKMFFSDEKKELKQSLETIRDQLLLADNRRANIGQERDLSEEPIAKTLYPDGGNGLDASSWNEYRAWCQEHNGALNIEAKQVTVSAVRWLNDEIVELSLYQQVAKIFVTPLQPVPEGYREDEVRPGDTGLLVGRYFAIGEPDNENADPKAPLIMTNYLKITGQEEESKGRRGMNRGQKTETRLIQSFK
ncbi:uncharacterized protein KY384_007930 [Bacidia gigantensis]|uniref:uncharacterized protein n=1 Tax=Bacidia gigantensis TaxID=2732470 RepID=UPI001D04A162|nr:uncharacterized protein KY384_007930 [Bacidia gigantensis]KAG8527776.1 hypothetical protein KY384_007930 [Bacidia gigantensis]